MRLSFRKNAVLSKPGLAQYGKTKEVYKECYVRPHRQKRDVSPSPFDETVVPYRSKRDHRKKRNLLKKTPSEKAEGKGWLEIFSSLLQRSNGCDVGRVSSCLPMSTQSGPLHQRRKFSFPVTLQSNLLGLDRAQKRRFSNVSDAVSRKFSNTIGWNRAPPIATKEIVAQGKTLCGQYIRSRLKRCGMLPRKCGLQRLRSVASLPGGYIVREVLPELVAIGTELERMHPKVYTGVFRQASHSPGPPTEKGLASTLGAISKELMRSDITWAKVVSLYAVAGGLALDCVVQGHPEYLQTITDAMADALDEDSAIWIAENGGWTGLLTYCKPPSAEISLSGFLARVGVIMACAIILALILRWFGKFTHIS